MDSTGSVYSLVDGEDRKHSPVATEELKKQNAFLASFLKTKSQICTDMYNDVSI